jgi:hypothetical protein
MLGQTTRPHAHTPHVVVHKLKPLPFGYVAYIELVLAYPRFGTTHRSDMSRNVGKNYQASPRQHRNRSKVSTALSGKPEI